MLPHLSLLNGGEAGAPVRVPPPSHFRGVIGRVAQAYIAEGKWTPPRGNTAAKRAGIAYENSAQKFLKSTLGADYTASPAYHFRDESGWRTCIPDGLFVLQRMDVAAVFEIKAQHVPEAWWQLRKLYEPVTRKILGNSKVVCVEMCKSYDPHTPFPEEHTLIENLDKFLWEAKNGELGVMRWRP